MVWYDRMKHHYSIYILLYDIYLYIYIGIYLLYNGDDHGYQLGKFHQNYLWVGQVGG